MTLPGDLPPDDPDTASAARRSELDHPAPRPAAAAPALVACWRCGLSFAENMRTCPVCGATNRQFRALESFDSDPALSAAAIVASGKARSPKAAAIHDIEARALPACFKVFLILLATSVFQGAVIYGMKESLEGDELEHSANALMVLVELIDTAVVFAALYWIGRPPRPARVSGAARLTGGLAGVAAVGVAFGLNLLYHHLLQLYIFPNGVPDVLLEGEEWSLFCVLTTIVQPAIVEELFFRYLVLDNLRAVTSARTAIWISSIAFGMAHLGNPIGIPVLVLVGASLGYLRVWSGALWAPMLMHAVHNGLILLLET